MEIWDLYDDNRALTGETMVRGDRVPEGRYHLIVDAHFLNSKGETLLQRRAKGKSVLPDIWSSTGGSALRGEDSAAACIREVSEEMGFAPNLEHSRILETETRGGPGNGYIRDVYLIFQDVPLSQLRLQPEEVQDAVWILPEKIQDDPVMWGGLSLLTYWKQLYPYLCLESFRIRIPTGVYRHYKGNRYEVKGLALHSETLEPMVIYRALYGPGEIWTRPAKMWNEWIELKDGTKKRRFEKIDENL